MCVLHVIYIALIIANIYSEISLAFINYNDLELSTIPSDNDQEYTLAAETEGNIKLSKTKSKVQKKIDATKYKTIKITILKGDNEMKTYPSTSRLVFRRNFKKFGYVPISEDLDIDPKFLPNHHIVRKNLDNSGLPLLGDKFNSLHMLL